MLLFLIPILDIGVRTNVISTIKIPEFITDYIVNNETLSMIVLAIYILLTVLLSKMDFFYPLYDTGWKKL